MPTFPSDQGTRRGRDRISRRTDHDRRRHLRPAGPDRDQPRWPAPRLRRCRAGPARAYRRARRTDRDADRDPGGDHRRAARERPGPEAGPHRGRAGVTGRGVPCPRQDHGRTAGRDRPGRRQGGLMLTYHTIAAGAPSDAAGMTDYLLSEEMPQEVADLARYYGKEAGELGPELRQDMHPIVAQGLGIDAARVPSRDEINALLAGRRADGDRIEGKQYSKLREYKDPKTGEMKEKVPLGSVDFCLSPDKSVSVAWAFGTPAERAGIHQAHHDAAHEVMLHLEREIGRASKGKGGRDGYDQGHIAWIVFDHYTSRPTLWIGRDEAGRQLTENVPVQVAGDPELH